MLNKNMSRLLEIPTGLTREAALARFCPSQWEIVVLVSFCAGLANGWRVLLCQAELLSPITAAVTMTLLTFAGWYVWGFFTHLNDVVLFGGRSDYRGTLKAFGWAYVFQVLFVFSFTRPLGWMWGWIALYATVVAWGIVGPRHLGMRTWQAMVAAALGMLLWLACLLAVTLVLVWDGTYLGIGAFLA
jgi:hypothetical protein